MKSKQFGNQWTCTLLKLGLDWIELKFEGKSFLAQFAQYILQLASNQFDHSFQLLSKCTLFNVIFPFVFLACAVFEQRYMLF